MRYSEQAMYTIKEASSRSGVSVPLLRAWERRYGVVAPLRTDSGYRLYDEAAIDRLRAMRQLIAHGWSARQAAARIAESSRDEVAVLAHTPGVASEASEGPRTVGAAEPTVPEELVGRIVSAARELDLGTLEALLDEAFASARFEVVADGIVMPALRAIGEGWANGEISVAAEHAASHAVLRRLAMAFEAAGDAGLDRPVLVGLGPGSRHELGALAFAIAARRAGLPVLYLGPDLPAESWSAAATGRNASAAVIGVPTRADLPRAAQVVEALRAASPRLVVAVGGDAAERAADASGALPLPDRLADSVRLLRDAIAGNGATR